MKAVVIGGSNGIGLAISKQLIDEGYFVQILDMVEPRDLETGFTFSRFNMLEMDEIQISELACDPEVNLMMITAGIGRVAEFEYLHYAEIQKVLTIDVVSTIQIIRFFYDRIKSEEQFFCGVMGSIAGLVSSPMFSVYAAAKAGICRFIESVNIELETAEVSNRILCVAPGSIKGTRFNGGDNDLTQTCVLATEIIQHLKASDTLFIPQYEEVFNDVIKRYQNDAHEFGLSSYNYKKLSGRTQNERKVVIGYLSGTFDLFHVGHLNLLKRAKAQCDYLIVGVHDSGSWKGKETFIPLEERKEIVRACKYVDKVVDSCREDSDAWALWHYNRLFVGSDYKGTERFKKYETFFSDKDVEIVYFPYTQGTSSTQIRERIKKA